MERHFSPQLFIFHEFPHDFPSIIQHLQRDYEKSDSRSQGKDQDQDTYLKTNKDQDSWLQDQD